MCHDSMLFCRELEKALINILVGKRERWDMRWSKIAREGVEELDRAVTTKYRS